ncbi:MAG: alpha/beta fold hydrolase [Chloroflexota bacterium]|nr:alpha/beta fold hydrolase [Chloroflexota bacterium]
MFSKIYLKRITSTLLIVALLLCLGLAAAPLTAQDSLADAAAALAGSMAEYGVSESDISFSNAGQTIVGTLAMPAGEGPFPVALLLHGFTGTRHELPVLGTEDTMFSRAARWLGERGVASLRIDFRGSGESEGAWEDTTFSGQISDAIAALDYLEMLEGVDSGNMSILGLSQGGLVGAATAGRDARVSNLVLWSAVSNPVMSYGILLGYDNLLAGAAAGDEALSIVLPWGAETSLKGPFFEDIFLVDPVAEIAGYGGSLLAVTGARDTTVTPQPQAGQVFLDYHEGAEALVVLDGDHIFDVLAEVTEVIDEALAYSLAWLQGNW